MCGDWKYYEFCESFFNTLPVIGIILLIIWSYYVYVYEMCWIIIEKPVKMWLYLGFFHVFFLAFLSMYLLTAFHRKWIVPDLYYIPIDYFNKISNSGSEEKENQLLLAFCKSRNLRIYTRTQNGAIRVCYECGLVKPDRTHHCSVCKTCVIRMDHHCPWVNNCIGFTNYKYFIILVLYGGLYCSFYCATMTEYAIAYFVHLDKAPLRQINIVVASFITLSLAVVLWCLLGFHINLVLANETTVEAIHPPTFASSILVGYDKGRSENWEEVCTLNACYWCLPVDTMQGNGVNFEVLRY